MNLVVDLQKEEESAQVTLVNQLAFTTNYEANLVNALIKSKVSTISLVAKKGQSVVGHLLLSRMTVANLESPSNLKIYGLAPMAVLPNAQKCGIGTSLIKRAVEISKNQEIDAIFVLGHPEYYPKFGFISTKQWGITCQYDVPAKAFMVLDISGKLSNLTDKTVLYADIFQNVSNKP